jgi:hypothetical protein
MSDLFTAQFADYIFNDDHFPALGGDNKIINDVQEIDWDHKSILSADAFIDYKGVTKSLNPAVNMPCQVEVPIKTTPPLKRGRVNQQKDAFNKRPKSTRKTSSSKKVNASQSKVDGHQVDQINP